MNSTTREDTAQATCTRLRDLQQEITLFAKRSSSGSGASGRGGDKVKTDDGVEQSDWLDVLESRIAHLESIVASICHQGRECSIYAKAENIERWLSTMIIARAPKVDKPLSGTQRSR